nr:unnamed protein product [Digitaria exilis]
MADAAAYEAQRRRQIEENKRRIEELGLRQLAAAAMPPQWNRNTKILIGMSAVERSYAIAKAKVMELECELGANYPTFVKTITQSSATSFCLVLMSGLVKRQSTPPQFFREHLPEHVKVITLVDEEDDEFEVQYYKTPRDHHHYMTRWKWFAINHKLDAGDCLVFQLIEQTKFMVYIMRACSYLEKMTIKTESF